MEKTRTLRAADLLADEDDPKVQEFKQYLEEKGLMEVLTKILVDLYSDSDKPLDVNEYLRTYFSHVKEKNPEEIRKENEELKARLSELKAKLS